MHTFLAKVGDDLKDGNGEGVGERLAGEVTGLDTYRQLSDSPAIS
jgi:hypothetical protein